jgi:hypothetical protein
MSKVIGSFQKQIETGFAALERDVGLPYDASGSPRDGSLAFEEARHHQDANRKVVVSRCLAENGVPCSDDNILVLSQPTFDTPISYWNSMHDLVFFFRFILGKTLIIPGSALIVFFERTIETIKNLRDLKNVKIDVGGILLEMVREEFGQAMGLTRRRFQEIITEPIQNMEVAD